MRLSCKIIGNICQPWQNVDACPGSGCGTDAAWPYGFRTTNSRRKVIMARRLQDKLATIDPVRRARIEAEADRLQEEYLNMQQSPERQDDERNDTDSDHR